MDTCLCEYATIDGVPEPQIVNLGQSKDRHYLATVNRRGAKLCWASADIRGSCFPALLEVKRNDTEFLRKMCCSMLI